MRASPSAPRGSPLALPVGLCVYLTHDMSWPMEGIPQRRTAGLRPPPARGCTGWATSRGAGHGLRRVWLKTRTGTSSPRTVLPVALGPRGFRYTITSQRWGARCVSPSCHPCRCRQGDFLGPNCVRAEPGTRVRSHPACSLVWPETAPLLMEAGVAGTVTSQHSPGAWTRQAPRDRAFNPASSRTRARPTETAQRAQADPLCDGLRVRVKVSDGEPCAFPRTDVP